MLFYFPEAMTKLVTLKFSLPFHSDHTALLIFLLLYCLRVFFSLLTFVSSLALSLIMPDRVSSHVLFGYLSTHSWTLFPKASLTMSLISITIMTPKCIFLDSSFWPIFSIIYQLSPTGSSKNEKSYRIFSWIIVIYSITKK